MLSIPNTLLIRINFVLQKTSHPQVRGQSTWAEYANKDILPGRNTTWFPRGPSKLHLAYTWLSVYVHAMWFLILLQHQSHVVRMSFVLHYRTTQDVSFMHYQIFLFSYMTFTLRALCHSLEAS